MASLHASRNPNKNLEVEEMTEEKMECSHCGICVTNKAYVRFSKESKLCWPCYELKFPKKVEEGETKL
jgi:hypothetical protein